MAELINREDDLNTGRKKLNKSIEQSERAENKSDQAVNISNSALNIAQQSHTKSDTTQQEVDNIIIESGTSDAEVIQARGNHDLLYKRLDSTDAQLAETSTQISTSIGKFDWWTPPRQPSFNSTEPGFNPDSERPFEIRTMSYTPTINMLFGKFTDDPKLSGYATREVLGKDQSGQYDIHRFVFTPKNYEKTILLGAGLHGWERMGIPVLARFLYYVCYENDKYPQFNYIRNKVRLVVLPWENPWGYIHGNVRHNSRNVDINRNFPYHWDDYVVQNPGYDNKGSAPDSEVETQYIINTINEVCDAIAYIDFHNMNVRADDLNFHFFYPLYEATDKEMPVKIFSRFNRFNTLYQGSKNPSLYNYAARMDKNISNLDFVVGILNSDYPYESYDIIIIFVFAACFIF